VLLCNFADRTIPSLRAVFGQVFFDPRVEITEHGDIGVVFFFERLLDDLLDALATDEQSVRFGELLLVRDNLLNAVTLELSFYELNEFIARQRVKLDAIFEQELDLLLAGSIFANSAGPGRRIRPLDLVPCPKR
jgi:hypothetical protein